jgi:hypothetical protein
VQLVAAVHREDPGHELGDQERFDHVVVRSGFERPHEIGLVGRRADDDHVTVGSGEAELGDRREARAVREGAVGERDVDDDQVEPIAGEEAERALARCCAADVEPLLRQSRMEQMSDPSFVLDDQDRHFGLPADAQPRAPMTELGGGTQRCDPVGRRSHSSAGRTRPARSGRAPGRHARQRSGSPSRLPVDAAPHGVPFHILHGGAPAPLIPIPTHRGRHRPITGVPQPRRSRRCKPR